MQKIKEIEEPGKNETKKENRMKKKDNCMKKKKENKNVKKKKEKVNPVGEKGWGGQLWTENSRIVVSITSGM